MTSSTVNKKKHSSRRNKVGQVCKSGKVGKIIRQAGQQESRPVQPSQSPQLPGPSLPVPAAITLVTCWHIKRRDGVVIGFTECDRDLHIDGVTYLANSGATASAMVSTTGCRVDHMDIEGMLRHDILAADDIIAGRYNYAEIESFIVDYQRPAAGKYGAKRGWLGEVKMGKDSFVAEVRGLTQCFAAKVGEIYSLHCRASFGDKRCGQAADRYVVNDLVVSKSHERGSFSSDELFRLVSDPQAKQRLDGPAYAKGLRDLKLLVANGYVRFTTGRNQGMTFAIRSYGDNGEIILKLPPICPVEAGDVFTIHGGCDKSFGMCCDVFKNGINFRGEPHIPVPSEIMPISRTL